VNLEQPRRPERRRPRRTPLWHRPLVRVAALVLGLLLVLLVGVSIGRALEDGPAPGGLRTDVRTLDPRPLGPVTITVTR
jgi:hypothetical protein